MRKFLALCLLAALIPCSPARAADAKKEIKDLITTSVDSVLGVLKSTETTQANKKKQVLEIIDPLFDFPLTAKLVLGRKNWLFVASKTGGERAAILFSLVASCKANQLDPFAYLHCLFRELPSRARDKADLDDLLPDRWLAEHPEHRWHIDELRADE